MIFLWGDEVPYVSTLGCLLSSLFPPILFTILRDMNAHKR